MAELLQEEPKQTKKRGGKAKAAPAAPNNPKYEEVLRLKDEGLSVAEIAKKLNIGKGEVMLLFNLQV
jgi:DNA-binding NarL/FixJ family response regulator